MGRGPTEPPQQQDISAIIQRLDKISKQLGEIKKLLDFHISIPDYVLKDEE